MRQLLEQALAAVRNHPSPALSLDQLRPLVRPSGVEVRDEILLRALAETPDRIRIVDPWRGPWRTLGAGGGEAGAPVRPSRDARPRPPKRSLPGSAWVVGRPGRGSPTGRPLLDRLRSTVVHLGWELDLGSLRDTSRWCVLVRASSRATRAATHLHPERAGGGR